jgi:hypothetical protein
LMPCQDRVLTQTLQPNSFSLYAPALSISGKKCRPSFYLIKRWLDLPSQYHQP